MPRFFIALIALSAVCHIPFVFGLYSLLQRSRVPHPALVSAGAAALLVLALLGRLGRIRSDRPSPAWRVLLIEEPYFAHWGATVLSLPLTPPFALAIFIAERAAPGRLPPFITGSAALSAYASALMISAWGVFIRRRWVRVRTVDIAVFGLEQAFHGYRIAHLSDLHIGSLCPKARAQRWTFAVNALGVDLVALTGDYVTSGSAFHDDIVQVLSGMQAKDGVFAVMGNHDYFGDGDGLIQKLQSRGVRVLRNEWTTIARGPHRLTLAGVDDTWSRRANIPRSLEGRDASRPVLVLAHDPALFPKLAKQGAGLVLSGHTHWGQIALPFFAARANLSRLSFRYHAGLYTEGRSTLYISPGLGTTGPPIRLGSPPEITVLRLVQAPEDKAPAERAEAGGTAPPRA